MLCLNICQDLLPTLYVCGNNKCRLSVSKVSLRRMVCRRIVEELQDVNVSANRGLFVLSHFERIAILRVSETWKCYKKESDLRSYR